MNGPDAMVAIRGEFPDAKIIILTTHASDADAMKLGARVYLLTAQLGEELLGIIRAVKAGTRRVPCCRDRD